MNLPANHQIQMERSNKPFKPSIQLHLHTIHPFFHVTTTYRENVGAGWLSSLIRLVVMLVVCIRVRVCQRVTS